VEFSISKDSFSQLLYLTSTIVEKRNTMPILANVKLTAEGESLKVSATDLEVSLVGESSAKVKTPGSITIDAKVLHDIVKELPSTDISLSMNKNRRLEIESGQSRFRINGTAADEFPAVAGVELKNPISIDASKFFEMLDKTYFAVSTDETRYNINGVYAETIESGSDKSILRFVATDGHRLAMIDRPAEGVNFEQSVIIPRKGIQEIKKVLEGNNDSARISIGDGFFTVESNNVTLGIRLVDGQFPDYKQVVPTEHKTEVELNRADLITAIKRVAIVTTDKTRAVKCKFSKNALLISSSSAEYGEASECIDIDHTGEDVTIGFSSRYVIDLLSAMSESSTITVKLNGELGPGLFMGDKNEAYSGIVMPMRFE